MSEATVVKHSEDSPGTTSYELVGLVVHNESATRGYYLACIQQAGQWKEYNDAKVTSITVDQAEGHARQGYLYFYCKIS